MMPPGYEGPEERVMFARALETAPTVLEALFWGWLCRHKGAERLFFEELLISPLEGPQGVPDDFPGELEAPDW